MKKMPEFPYRLSLLFAILLSAGRLFAQAPGDSVLRYRIGAIDIHGNRVTKPYIILRELGFGTGDSVTIAELVRLFVPAREHLINTRLFNEVVVYLKEFQGTTAVVGVDVKERWYIFPLPYLRPVDRNFTAWSQMNYSLKRLDYGLKYSHYNFTGRNDYLRLWAITGYTKQLELAYDNPYIDPKLKHGIGFSVLYAGLKELNEKTLGNEQQFVNSDTVPAAGRFLRQQFSVSLRYYYRPAIRTRHSLRLSFNNIRIDSTVLANNPEYLAAGRLHVFYPELSYVVNYNEVDYVPYPLRGFWIEGSLTKRGITPDMNMWQAYVRSEEAVPLFPKMSFVSQNNWMLRVPFRQPFYNEQLFGYNDFYQRGLEKYVIDGVAGFVARNSVVRELFNFNIPFIRGTSHDHLPFRVYGKIFSDLGYVYNKYNTTNSLVNRMLYTEGAGIDVVTYYDFVFRVEYSFNQLGEKGLFFHIKNDF